MTTAPAPATVPDPRPSPLPLGLAQKRGRGILRGIDATLDEEIAGLRKTAEGMTGQMTEGEDLQMRKIADLMTAGAGTADAQMEEDQGTVTEVEVDGIGRPEVTGVTKIVGEETKVNTMVTRAGGMLSQTPAGTEHPWMEEEEEEETFLDLHQTGIEGTRMGPGTAGQTTRAPLPLEAPPCADTAHLLCRGPGRLMIQD